MAVAVSRQCEYCVPFYVEAGGPHRNDEFVVIADTDDEDTLEEEFGSSGYELLEKIEIFDSVGRWPTDRALRSR